MDRRVNPLSPVNSVEPIHPKRKLKESPRGVKRRWEDFLEEEERREQDQQSEHPPLEGKEEPPGEAAPTLSGQDPEGVLNEIRRSPQLLLEAHATKDRKGHILDSLG